MGISLAQARRGFVGHRRCLSYRVNCHRAPGDSVKVRCRRPGGLTARWSRRGDRVGDRHRVAEHRVRRRPRSRRNVRT